MNAFWGTILTSSRDLIKFWVWSIKPFRFAGAEYTIYTKFWLCTKLSLNLSGLEKVKRKMKRTVTYTISQRRLIAISAIDGNLPPKMTNCMYTYVLSLWIYMYMCCSNFCVGAGSLVVKLPTVISAVAHWYNFTQRNLVL